MKQSAQIAYLRQVCASALPADAVVALLADALPALVPSAFVICWTNDDAGKVKSTAFSDTSLASHYNAEYPKIQSAGLDPNAELSFNTRLLGQRSVIDSTRNMERAFLRSPLYEQVLGPLNVGSGMRAAVISPRGRSAGIAVCRLRGERKLGEVQERQLAAVLPYVEYALDASPPTPDAKTVFDGAASMAVNPRNGERFENPAANRLFSLAAGNHVDAERLKREWITHLVHNLVELDGSGPPKGQHALPQFTVKSAFGTFTLRAQWLMSSLRPDRRLASIDIERHIPQRLLALESVRRLPLSPRQRDICVRLVEDLSVDTIATTLGLRRATLAGYITEIYERLGVHSRAGLVEHVLAQSRQVALCQ